MNFKFLFLITYISVVFRTKCFIWSSLNYLLKYLLKFVMQKTGLSISKRVGIRAQFLKYRVFSKLFGRCVVGRERHSNPSALIINVIGLSLAIYEPDTNSPAHIYGHVNSLFTVSNSKLGKTCLSFLREKSRIIWKISS